MKTTRTNTTGRTLFNKSVRAIILDPNPILRPAREVAEDIGYGDHVIPHVRIPEFLDACTRRGIRTVRYTEDLTGAEHQARAVVATLSAPSVVFVKILELLAGLDTIQRKRVVAALAGFYADVVL